MKGSVSISAVIVTTVIILSAVAGGFGTYYYIDNSDGGVSAIPFIGSLLGEADDTTTAMDAEGDSTDDEDNSTDEDSRETNFSLEDEMDNVANAIISRVQIFSYAGVEEMRSYNKVMFPQDAEAIDALSDEELLARGVEYAEERTHLTRESLADERIVWTVEEFGDNSIAVAGALPASSSTPSVNVMAVRKGDVWY